MSRLTYEFIDANGVLIESGVLPLDKLLDSVRRFIELHGTDLDGDGVAAADGTIKFGPVADKPSKKKRACPAVTNDGGFLSYKKAGETYHVGYLLRTGGAVYDATLGRLDSVTPAEAQKHNELLSAAEIAGLKSCAIGQGRTFYLKPDGRVTTWIGELVSPKATISGRKATFVRNGCVFQARSEDDEAAVFFKRIA